MTDERDPDHGKPGEDFATTNQPLHGEKRPVWTPYLGVLLLVVLVLGVFALITWLRWTT